MCSSSAERRILVFYPLILAWRLTALFDPGKQSFCAFYGTKLLFFSTNKHVYFTCAFTNTSLYSKSIHKYVNTADLVVLCFQLAVNYWAHLHCDLFAVSLWYELRLGGWQYLCTKHAQFRYSRGIPLISDGKQVQQFVLPIAKLSQKSKQKLHLLAESLF